MRKWSAVAILAVTLSSAAVADQGLIAKAEDDIALGEMLIPLAEKKLETCAQPPIFRAMGQQAIASMRSHITAIRKNLEILKSSGQSNDLRAGYKELSEMPDLMKAYFADVDQLKSATNLCD